MTKSIRLTDHQLVLLSHAAKNTASAVHPLPASAAGDPERTAKDLKSLLRRGLLIEAEVDNPAASWRNDDGQPIGLLISDKGREAIGIEQAPRDSGTEGADAAPAPVPAPRVSKQSLVVDLLQRAEGATLAEVMAATGWLPHSTRAALTGLRKKGHIIDKSKRGEETCYRITEASV